VILPVLAIAAAALSPLAIHVDLAASVPRPLVGRILDEAATIWGESGVRLAWRTVDGDGPRVLRILIDDDPGPPAGGALAIGWIRFADDGPMPEIHLSYANALEGLARARAFRHAALFDPLFDSQLVAVALGRALAHELGHYLLGSALHGSGLMAAEWMPSDLFGADTPLFHLTAAQRQTIAARIAAAWATAPR
jgi:hypothetical protein